MALRRSRIAARLRRRFARAGRPSKPEPTPAPGPVAALRGLGERPAAASGAPADQAAEAELDTLRGELVRELERRAESDDGPGSFRRLAS